MIEVGTTVRSQEMRSIVTGSAILALVSVVDIKRPGNTSTVPMTVSIQLLSPCRNARKCPSVLRTAEDRIPSPVQQGLQGIQHSAWLTIQLATFPLHKTGYS